MKKIIIFVLMFMVFVGLQLTVNAQTGRFGAGFIIGDPTGLSFKYKLNNINSLQFILGWSDNGNFHLVGDYTFTYRNLIQPHGNLTFPVHIGGGVHIFNKAKNEKNEEDEDEFKLGPRFVAGIGIEIQRFEIFVEVGVGLFIVPSTDGNITGGLGARFFF